jgi:[ribosomal protein S5]-alanine N-acetyltransferase
MTPRRAEPAYEILTARLRLRALSLEEVRLLMRGERAVLSERLQAVIPDEWPEPRLASALPIIASDMAERAGDERWVWAIVEPVRETPSATVVGDIGFHGLVTGSTTVEIGYIILPGARGRGYATEAAAALIEWALAQPGVVRVTAKIAPTNHASLHVASKLGMRETRSDEPEFRCFERVRSPR